MEFKNISLKDLNANTEDGTFEGYGATFGNVDLVNDVIVKGAFSRHIQENGTLVKLLYQHDREKVIGVAYVTEDERGLKVKGEINQDVQLGKEVRSLMKQGALDSMSIGYVKRDYQYDDAGNRILKDLELREISIVTFPANPLAQVTNVKSIATARDFERFLRDSGFSRRQACAIASAGFKAYEQSESEDEQKDQDDEALLKFYESLNERFK